MLKILYLVGYLVIAAALIVLSLMQTKQERGASAAIMGAGKDSFYEKNKARTKEAKMDLSIVILAVIFAVATFGLYFIF